MMDLIKNFKTKNDIQVKYLQCDNARENVDFEGSANRKGWEWSLSILPQVPSNRIAVLNRSSLPCLIGYVPCSMVGHFSPF